MIQEVGAAQWCAAERDLDAGISQRCAGDRNRCWRRQVIATIPDPHEEELLLGRAVEEIRPGPARLPLRTEARKAMGVDFRPSGRRGHHATFAQMASHFSDALAVGQCRRPRQQLDHLPAR